MIARIYGDEPNGPFEAVLATGRVLGSFSAMKAARSAVSEARHLAQPLRRTSRAGEGRVMSAKPSIFDLSTPEVLAEIILSKREEVRAS